VIHSKAIVCQGVELKGDITIGPSGIIEEGAIIVNRFVTGPSVPFILRSLIPGGEVMRIGDDNLFEIGCRSSTVSSLVPCDRL
jgi:dynactin-6